MKTLKLLGIIFSTLLIILMGLIGAELLKDPPYPEFETLYDIGVRDFAWTDSSRTDSFSNTARTLLVRVWYPTESYYRTPYEPFHPVPERFAADVSAQYGIPAFIISRLGKSKTKSRSGVSASSHQPSYPVLIFSHGMNGSRVQNTAQMEYLAGNGYVVFGIEHTGSSSGTVLPDGTQPGYYEFNGMMSDRYSDSLAVTWSDDQLFVVEMIDSLKNIAFDDLFLKLDTGKLGLFGHSYGGHTAAYTLSRSGRFISGINMDGYYFGTTEKKSFKQPFLEIRAPWPAADSWDDSKLAEMGVTRAYMEAIPESWDKKLEKLSAKGAVRVMVHGTNHMTFSDFLRVTPFRNIFMPDYDEQYLFVMELVKSWFSHTFSGGTAQNFKVSNKQAVDYSATLF